ncbi:MAG TPA: EAL domain-containing protein [Thermoanaerobaculia bacterium]
MSSRIDRLLNETENRLRRQNSVLVELARRRSIHSGNLADALRDITEAAADTLEVERFGIWFFTPDRQILRCVDLYERTSRLHTSGDEMTAVRHPVYFKALETERSITAHDALLDPRTSGFADPYLNRFGVTSMLDAPIRRLGQMSGVISFEHVGPQRTWTAEEENFASSIADLVTMALDATDRREQQEALRHRLDYETLIAAISTRFANAGDDELDGAIVDALANLAVFVGVPRAHVFLVEEDGLSAHLAYEWNDTGSVERRNLYGELPTASFPWWAYHLRHGHIVRWRTLDELPPEAVNEKRLAERYGILSAIFVPLRVNKDLAGSVGLSSVVEECDWSEETVQLLRTSSEIIGSALERIRTFHALRASEERYRLLFERNQAGVYRNTLDGRMLDCNDAMPNLLGYDDKDEFLRLNARDLYFDRDQRKHFIESVQANSGMRSIEVCLRRRDGQPVWLLESVHLIEGQILEGTVIDITDRKRTENALRESEERYRLMAENSTDLISRTSRRGIFVYASDAIRSLLGYEPQEMIGRHVLDFVHPDDHHIVRRFIGLIELRRSSHTFSYRARRKDGSEVWFETTSRALINPVTKTIDEIVSVSRDISERRRAEEQIEYQAYHDSLTGLPNRLLFRDRLTIALAHAKRQESGVAVMFLDLDRFKLVNDTLGHSLGDELLRVIATRLRSVLREGDTIARMGGDEFTVLLGDLRDSNAATIAQKLLDTVAEPVRIEGHELYVTTSIGIALFPNDGETAESLLKNADAAMYRAKDLGRNSFQLCTAAMNSRATERLSIESALRRAIERDELVLHFQPIVMLDSRSVSGMEALLRWNRPGFGIVPPASFIDIAEETRMIVPIGEWVLREACKRAKTWQTSGHESMRIAVNLSPRQFQQSDLRAVVARALSDSGLAAGSLELEITETTAMLNTDRTMRTLSDLRDLGVHIALDDFGTGHSSLNYLRRFPIDRVKVDREFVAEIEESASDRAIVSAIVAMAHGLNLAVTAEGVETEGQVAFLREQGCEEVQGFLFGRPSAI